MATEAQPSTEENPVTNYAIAFGYALATLTSAFVALRGWRARPGAGPTWLAVTMVGAATWAALSLAAVIYGYPVDGFHMLFTRLEWVCIGVIGVGMVGVGLALSGREATLTRGRVAALSAVPAVGSAMALSDPRIVDLYVAVVGPVGPLADVFAVLSAAWSAFYWVTLAYVYLLLAVGTLFIVETVVERPTYHPGRLLLVGMVVPPWAVNVLYLGGVLPYGGWDPTPLGFAVTGLAGMAAVDRFRLLDVPLARAKVVGGLDTAVLVYGAGGALYDYNERAAALLDVSAADVDAPVTAALAASPLALDDLPTDGAALTDALDGREVSLSAPADAGDAALATDADDAVPATDDRDAVPAADGNGTDEATAGNGTDEATVGNGADETAAAIRGSDRSPRRRVLVRATSLDDRGGRPLGYAVQLTDITEKHRRHERLREKSRRLEHKNEQLERLAGIVAHDLQTPLATGRNLLDLLRMDVDTDDPEVAQSLADLERVHDRLDEFAEGLPALARESTDVEEPADCDLETLATDAWAVVDTGPLDLAVEGTCRLRGDPVRLRQAFENLFANAAEHATASGRGPATASGREPATASDREPATGAVAATGGGRSSDDDGTSGATVVSVGPLAPDGGTGSVTSLGDGRNATGARGFYVADDGPGVPPGVRERVAEFGVSTGDGSGFGLAIVRTVVEAHGWSFAVCEAANGGARFEVTFDP